MGSGEGNFGKPGIKSSVFALGNLSRARFVASKIFATEDTGYHGVNLEFGGFSPFSS
jgi:hypothetical protein